MSSEPASGSNGASKKKQRRRDEDDDEDGGAPGSSDEEGIDLMNSDGDSSEEDDDDDAEEEARIREGFIADEDEDDGARERRKRRKHKKKKNREREFEALSEDDLDLVEQNTGVRIERPEGRKLKKLKRAGAASDDEDEEDSGDARAPDIANLFDDISSRARKDKGKRRAQERDAADDGDGDADGLGADLMEEDDMADFIEEDSPDEDGTGEVRDREARLARKQKERERRKKQKGGFSIGGLDMGAEAWGEIQEVFGDGHDYDDALESDEEDGKPAPRMQDVFEPSEIAERMMTDADDIIRATDIPERMQIAQTGISTHRTPPPPTVLEGEETPAEPESSDLLLFRSELGDAANWISTRISDDLTREYILTPDGHIPELRGVFVTAIQRVLQFLCEQCFEVPFIWMHRRDYFIHHDPTASNAANRERTLLDRDDLWKIYHLAIKYRAMLDRKANLLKLWGKLGIEEDEHFTDTFAQIESLEEAADLVEYVMVKHQRRLKDLAQAAGADIIAEDQDADAVRTASDGSKYKRATSGSRYEKAKDSLVARFAEQIAVPAEALAAGFEAGSKQAHIEDPPSAPEDFAEQFTDVTSLFADYDQVINAAKVILVHEISKEPILKKGVRTAFRTFGAVSVKPTEKGAQKVDDTHPYNAFKYLLDKPVDHFLQSTQFLQILDAESEGLVTVDIHIMKEPLRKLTQDFYTAYLSESTSEIGRAWNKVREDIVVEALQYHLLPMAARWTKDWLKETEEDWLAARCARALEDRVNQAPYDRDTQPKWPPGHAREAENVPVHPNPQPSDPKKNIPPKVMAISSGNGDRQRDWVETVVLAPKGRFAGREKYKEIRYRDSKHAMRLQILRTRPDVVVVGGFTANTHELRLDVQATLQLHDKEIQDRLDQKLADLRSIDRDVQRLDESDIKDALTDEQYQQMVIENWVHHLPVVFVNDEVARLYQNSERAQAEFAELSPVERYCVGLARHVQDPLCEYAALGNDITALSFDPDQRLISREKLLPILESAIVNIVNMTGVDINKAIREPNYRVLLPYVSGLGLRKASGMVRRITAASEGTLICRADLVKKEICTSRIFMNCVAFLRIPRENMEDEDDYDILDSTRIHSEDYHIARKMAGDAEEMDEEDLEDLPHPSAIVAQLMADDPQKLNELSLDDFAAALFETQQLQKRLTLYMIRDELQRPYSDPRQVYRIKAGEGAFTMLTGETRRSLEVHLVVPMVVTRIIKDERVVGRLDSGVTVEAVPPEVPVPMPFRVGQTIQALVTSLDINKFKIGVSLLPEHVAAADHTSLRKVQPDQFYDNIQASMDKQADEARNKRSQGRHRRVVNHPNFYNFNAGQAEQHLANLQRGDCVVRPSSRGTDHLAVTWKVDDGVYQHIDVLELDKQNEFSLGKSLRVQGKYTYSDLDELIVSYVRSMARKVDEMMHSDKYKGTEADLRKWLNTSIMAEPARSFYGFALDPRKPGNFILAFLTKGYEIQSWSISVEPEQFLLQGNSDPAPNVTMLCNAFKSMYMTRQAMLAGSGGGGGGAALGGRTPHLGGRTPNPAAGARTPAQTGTTPYGSRSPYVHRGAPPPQAHQMRPQTPQYMAQQQQHYQPPPPGPPAQPSGGAFMHPSRMQQAGFGR